MKKVVNVVLNAKSFAITEDAYDKLKRYLVDFESSSRVSTTGEMMDDLEERIAELFAEKLSSYRNVIDIEDVNRVIAIIGMPDGSVYDDASSSAYYNNARTESSSKKLYRDGDDMKLGGVCSGLSHYFGIDISLVRVCFVLLLIFGTMGFWVYIVLWLIIPKAETPYQKCEMYGLPKTAQNILRFK